VARARRVTGGRGGGGRGHSLCPNRGGCRWPARPPGGAFRPLPEGVGVRFWRPGRLGPPHHRRGAGLAWRCRIRRHLELLPVPAGPERRQRHGLHRRQIPRPGRRAGGARRIHPDPMDGRLHAWRVAVVLRADGPAPGHPARHRRGGRPADHRNGIPAPPAASQPPRRAGLRRARLYRPCRRSPAFIDRRSRARAVVDRVGAAAAGPGAMNPSVSLVTHIALLAIISFGGVPGVLPDLREFVVITNGWLTDRDFANCFAIVQAIPGPNMILMMSFIGWQVGGLPTAIAGALVTFVPPCALAYTAFGFWDRFRDTAWQQRLRRGLAPVTIGLIIAGGTVMART